MDWHYADGGQQLGPVNEDELLNLARTGVIKPETLVWNTGMTDWKPFREAGPGAPPRLPVADNLTRACTSCGRQFPAGDLAVFGNSAICADCKPAWVQKLRQGMTTTSPTQLRYAGFWIRFGALMIDGLIYGAAFGIIFFAFFGGQFLSLFQASMAAGARGEQVDPSMVASSFATIGLFELVAFVIAIGYSVFFLVKYGASPGKMALGLKVVTPDGGPISIGRAIGRVFAHWLSGIILYIGFMMAGWDDEKRALHDRIAGTRVIYTR